MLTIRVRKLELLLADKSAAVDSLEGAVRALPAMLADRDDGAHRMLVRNGCMSTTDMMAVSVADADALVPTYAEAVAGGNENMAAQGVNVRPNFLNLRLVLADYARLLGEVALEAASAKGADGAGSDGSDGSDGSGGSGFDGASAQRLSKQLGDVKQQIAHVLHAWEKEGLQAGAAQEAEPAWQQLLR